MTTYIFDFNTSQPLTEEQLVFIQKKLEDLFMSHELDAMPSNDPELLDIPEEITVPRLVVGG